MKKIGVLFATIIMAMLFAVSASALETTGRCGDNVYWDYNSATGELVISGTGPMYDYDPDKSPFYYSEVETVVIEDAVESIGDNAFHKCHFLTSIIIPDGVITIGYHAFYDCTSLTSIAIPDSVTKIDFYAFGNCDKLINVSIPDSAINIECTAFWGTACHNDEKNWEQGIFYLGNHLLDAVDTMENYVVRNGTVSIAGGVFVFNDSIKSIIIPDSVTTINRSAFDCCSNLETVILGNGVTTIGDAVFRNCKSLTNISLSNNLTTIGGSAFASCDKLTSITIPNNVTSIGSAAFMACKNLTNITIPNGITSISSSMFYLCENLKDIIIPDSVTSIENNAFLFCENLLSVSLSDKVTSIGNSAFYGCYALADIYYCGYEDSWLEIDVGEDNFPLNNANIHYKHKHIYSEVITTPATHTEEGTLTFTCECGDAYNELIAKLEEHSYVANVILPTCSEKGYTEYLCECGASYISDYVGMIAHSYVYSVVKPATHLIEGLGRYTCSKCGDHYDEPIAKTKEHSYTSTLVNSTCISQGYTLSECECGESFKSDYLAKIDHNDSNADGVCDNCGYELKANCSCNCHAGGIKGLIFKIILFFQKLFRMNRICEGCGVRHY